MLGMKHADQKARHKGKKISNCNKPCLYFLRGVKLKPKGKGDYGTSVYLAVPRSIMG